MEDDFREDEWHTSHFDIIEDYDGEIPQHVVVYLNGVKSEKTADAVCRFLQPQDKRIRGLDVGCGTGNHALALQELIPNSSIDGLDLSDRQLQRARDKGFPNLLVKAPMYNTGLSSSSYDFVVAVNSVHHLSSRKRQRDTFHEFWRILKPNGIAIIHEINVTNPLMRFYMKTVFPRTRSIDDGTELFLRSLPFDVAEFRPLEVEHFTFVPDFTPGFLMRPMIKIDYVLSRSIVAKFGAHVMWVIQKT